MLPATSPSAITALASPVGLARITVRQWVTNTSRGRAGNEARRFASGSSCWRKSTSRSASTTSRNRTSGVMGASLAAGSDKSASVQLRQGLAPSVLVAGRTRRKLLGEADDPGLVDDERAPVGDATLGVEHPVQLGDRAVWPEVGQQWELVHFAHGPHLVRRRRVDAHGEYLHLLVDEVVEVVPYGAELTLAGAG